MAQDISIDKLPTLNLIREFGWIQCIRDLYKKHTALTEKHTTLTENVNTLTTMEGGESTDGSLSPESIAMINNYGQKLKNLGTYTHLDHPGNASGYTDTWAADENNVYLQYRCIDPSTGSERHHKKGDDKTLAMPVASTTKAGIITAASYQKLASIEDNEEVTAAALTDLDSRISTAVTDLDSRVSTLENTPSVSGITDLTVTDGAILGTLLNSHTFSKNICTIHSHMEEDEWLDSIDIKFPYIFSEETFLETLNNGNIRTFIAFYGDNETYDNFGLIDNGFIELMISYSSSTLYGSINTYNGGSYSDLNATSVTYNESTNTLTLTFPSS